MTYSPTERLIRRFLSAQSMRTMLRYFREMICLSTVKLLRNHRKPIGSISWLQPPSLNCQGSVR
jgi:hypothetical protein